MYILLNVVDFTVIADCEDDDDVDVAGGCRDACPAIFDRQGTKGPPDVCQECCQWLRFTENYLRYLNIGDVEWHARNIKIAKNKEELSDANAQ